MSVSFPPECCWWLNLSIICVRVSIFNNHYFQCYGHCIIHTVLSVNEIINTSVYSVNVLVPSDVYVIIFDAGHACYFSVHVFGWKGRMANWDYWVLFIFKLGPSGRRGIVFTCVRLSVRLQGRVVRMITSKRIELGSPNLLSICILQRYRIGHVGWHICDLGLHPQGHLGIFYLEMWLSSW